MAKNKLVAEGKTKVVYREPPGTALIVSKNDLTGGNGKKHVVIPGKGVWATTTTCSVFDLLRRENVPVAFIQQVDETSFRAQLCDMILLEVVVRAEAHGSYLKRYPGLARGHRFDSPFVEFFLKTKGRKWKDLDLPCDDPLARFDFSTGSIELYEPDKPEDKPFASIPISDVLPREQARQLVAEMSSRALQVFQLLERGWARMNLKLVDFKLEFGFTPEKRLAVADVIDNDSWRLMRDGKYMDKQVFRDGEVDPALLRRVATNYQFIADSSERLKLR